jgi:hypothetical protein
LQDVALKLLLDAARGLAYMHHVDVVHGDVKSRNLLVFWEPEDSDDEGDEEHTEATTAAAVADEDIELMSGAAEVGELGGLTYVDQQQAAAAGKERPLVWTLKWCDFGVSFRAAEAPGGVLRTVRAAAAAAAAAVTVMTLPAHSWWCSSRSGCGGQTSFCIACHSAATLRVYCRTCCAGMPGVWYLVVEG